MTYCSRRSSPQALHLNATMGTPHARWREMTQSGRFSIMLMNRSLPQPGTHVTVWTASTVFLRGFFVLIGDEPLLGGAKDHGALAPPAVRIGVGYLLFGHERALCLQKLDDRLVRLEDMLAGELSRLIGKPSFIINRRVDVEAVAEAGLVILLTVARRRVHRARACVKGHMLSQDRKGVAVNEWVPRFEAF